MSVKEEAASLDLFPVDLCHELEVNEGLLLLALHDLQVAALIAARSTTGCTWENR